MKTAEQTAYPTVIASTLTSLPSLTPAWNWSNKSVNKIPGGTMGNVEMGAGLEHDARECAGLVSDIFGSGHGKARGFFSHL